MHNQQLLTMWQEIESTLPDITVLRRLLFASAHLAKESPNYWKIVCEFAFGYSEPEHYERVRILLENLEYLDSKAFQTDRELQEQLYSSVGYQHKPLGVVLISPIETCQSCGGKLLLRADRPSIMTLYTDDMGTLNGTHFRKYCQNGRKNCHYTQHYGFHTYGDSGDMTFDSDWDKLPYFVSTSKTAFSLQFLKKFEAELLLGQVSYLQKCSIYNYFNNYEQVKKQGNANNCDNGSEDHDNEDQLDHLG